VFYYPRANGLESRTGWCLSVHNSKTTEPKVTHIEHPP